MIKRFGFLFVVFVLLEIAGLILVGRLIGVLPTIGLVVLTMIVGLVVLKKQKLAALEPMMKTMQQGQPMTALPNVNLCALVSGILLIIPGFISDLVGLGLLIPWVQDKVLSKYLSVFTKRATTVRGTSTHRATIIQGDFKKKHVDNDV
jgi:UPF0716 protein FxsA